VNIRGRPGKLSGAPNRREQLHCATASSGGGVREADGARSGAGGENETEKGLNCVSTVIGDLGDDSWGEGRVWAVASE